MTGSSARFEVTVKVEVGYAKVYFAFIFKIKD